MVAKQAATPKASAAQRVESSYKQLSLAATGLNLASDELGKAVAILDAALKKLNLGISAWVQLSGGEEGDYWWSRNVGYSKAGDKWGIAINEEHGYYNHPDDDSVESWLFNEAPRWMRIEAVKRFPDLLEALIKQAEDTTNKIKDKTAQVYELAAAIGKVAEKHEVARQEGQK